MKKQEYEEISDMAIKAFADLKEESVIPSNSLNIGRFMVFPNRKVYCIAIKGSLIREMPCRIIEFAEKVKAIMLSGNFSLDISNPKIMNAVVFIDFTDSSVKPEVMVKYLEQLGVLKNITIFAPTASGFVCDSFFFPLSVGKERAIIFRKSMYEALFSGIRKEFGSAGEVFLYYMGLESGTRIFENYKMIIGFINIKTLIDMACSFAFTMGWGIFKLQELNLKKKTIKMRIYDNFECKAGENAGKQYSHFIRGVAAGLYMQLFKVAGTVEETKCIAQGDTFCEFLIKPAKPSRKILHNHI